MEIKFDYTPKGILPYKVTYVGWSIPFRSLDRRMGKIFSRSCVTPSKLADFVVYDLMRLKAAETHYQTPTLVFSEDFGQKVGAKTLGVITEHLHSLEYIVGNPWVGEPR